MRGLFLAAIVLCALGPLLSATTVNACTCGASTIAAEFMNSDIVVTGMRDSFEDDGDVVFRVSRYLKGDGDSSITISDPNPEGTSTPPCGLGEDLGVGPDTKVLFLNRVDGQFFNGYCRGLRVWIPDARSEDDLLRASTEYPDSFAPLSDLQQEESESTSKDIPWIPIVILAFVVPAAALLIPTFIRRKREAEDDDTGPRG